MSSLACQSIGRYHITEQLGLGGMATVLVRKTFWLTHILAMLLIISACAPLDSQAAFSTPYVVSWQRDGVRSSLATRLPIVVTALPTRTLLTTTRPTVSPTSTATSVRSNSVTILSITPSIDVPLKTGQSTEFTIRLHYTFISANQSTLAIYLEEFRDGSDKCRGSFHRTNGATYTFINRGENDLTIRVRWSGNPVVSSKGFLIPGASFFAGNNENRGILIQGIGTLGGYCYTFSP